jgi:alpha-L-arabinofuranosidase
MEKPGHGLIHSALCQGESRQMTYIESGITGRRSGGWGLARVASFSLFAFWALAWGFTAVAHAQAALPIYDDAPLTGGWQDQSWATVDVASTAAVHGGATSIAVAAGAYQALALRHEPFSTAGYGNLTFWINGGAQGQARLAVKVTVNDIEQPVAVEIGPVAAGVWRQVSIPLASFGVDDVSNLTAIWIQEFAGTDQSQNPFYVDDLVLAIAVPTIPAPPLDGAMALYDDGFANGWQDWSWAAVNSANPAPVNSGASSIAVTAAAYSALRFHHAPLDTQGYTNLTFWINGGAAGGQLLSLNALIGGVLQPGLLVGPLAANTWQKFVVPLSALGAATNPNLTDLLLLEITGVDAPTFYVDDVRLELAPPPEVVNVTVDARRSIRRVDARMFGLNAAIWDGAFNTPTTVGLLDEIDNQALRFPGGSLSNVYHWKTNLSDGAAVPWATSFDAFAATATATHAQVFITVNYGTGTPEEAADWVRHSNVENGYGFKYWEIGNENYGSWEVDNNPRPHDPVTYATRFAEYARQMKAIDPSIKIGAVIQASEDSDVNYLDEVVVNPRTGLPHSGWSAVMLATFRQLGVTPDFVTYHRYEQAPGGESDAFLLTASQGWAGNATSIRQLLNDYLGPKAKRVEIDSTETNSVYADPGKQTTSLVNGLFLADSAGNIMKTEFNALIWWALRNSAEGGHNNGPSLYGWRRYGDYGVVNFATPAGPADRYPTFYVFKLLKNYARGGETVVEANSDYAGLGVYAVRDAKKRTLNLLIINKHPARALNASVTIGGFQFGRAAEVYSYGIPQDDAAHTGVGSADVASTTTTLTGPTFSWSPGPYSATVIRLSQSHHGAGDHDDAADGCDPD